MTYPAPRTHRDTLTPHGNDDRQGAPDDLAVTDALSWAASLPTHLAACSGSI
jgi:hypothetical protein